MKTKIFSAVLAAMVLANTGITASAAEATVTSSETSDETTAVTESADEQTVSAASDETTAKPADNRSGENNTDMEKFMDIMSTLAENGNITITPNSETPDYYGDTYYDTDGNATLIKSEQIIYNTSEMQFISVTTKDGHVFYVLINYSAKNGEDNVYFLNKVDDYDLYALLYAGDDKDNTITPEKASNAAEAAENARSYVNSEVNAEDEVTDSPETADSDEQAKANMKRLYALLGVIALMGAGAVFYMFTKKKNTRKPEVKFEKFSDEAEEDEDYEFYDGNDEDSSD